MNCDQVFEVLTRGPFPSGDKDDSAVEKHLISCDGCRRLAEALQPAVELFEEAVDAEESVGLPGYWGDLFSDENDRESEVSPGFARRTKSPTIAAKSRVVARYPARRRAASAPAGIVGIRIAAALLLGVALGGALGSFSPNGSDATVPTVDHGATPVVASMGAGRWQDAFGLAAACLNGGHANEVFDTAHAPSMGERDQATHDVQCCSDCHRRGAVRGLAETSQARLVMSCRVCHDETSSLVALD